jgi:hypothetical protein
MSEIKELKESYNNQLLRLNKGYDYLDKNMDEYDKFQPELIKITRVLGSITLELEKQGIKVTWGEYLE